MVNGVASLVPDFQVATWVQERNIVVDANARACVLFGYTEPALFIGTDILSCLVDDSSDMLSASEEAMDLFLFVASGNDARAEWQCRRPDGGEFTIQVAMGRTPGGDGSLISVIAWEVTELKGELLRLAALNRRMEDFIANFSHEIRSSLFSILGFGSILRNEDSALDTGQLKEFLSIVNIEIFKISSLVEEVLSISRIKAGKNRMKKRPVDLSVVVGEVVEEMTVAAREKGLSLRLHVSDGSLPVQASPEDLKQLFVNLVDNALKCTPCRGLVELSAWGDASSGTVVVEVTDSGIGIPESDRPFVFEKFYRVSRPGFPAEGHGLGLAIVKMISDAYDGKISFSSTEGAGTVFRLELPLQEQAQITSSHE